MIAEKLPSVDDGPAVCHRENPHVSSETATRSNELLGWSGDNDGLGNVGRGVVVRLIEGLENMVFQNISKLLLVPASYVHASMKAPNPMYGGSFSVGILAGSRLDINNKNTKNGHSNNNLVNMTVCYPGDAGTFSRPALSGEATVLQSSHGQGCHNTRQRFCDAEQKCLMNEKCRCTDSSVVPNFGDHLSNVLKTGILEYKQLKLERLTFYACWYETPDRLAELVGASNTLFAERHQWSTETNVRTYEGYTECPVTTNIHKLEAIDAVVVQLPIMEIHYNGTMRGLCDLSNGGDFSSWRGTDKGRGELVQLLREMHDRFGPLPVLFLSQTRGIADQEECDRVWGRGTDCGDGYRKEFTAQTYRFSNGSCLAKPAGCPDVYFFPVCSNSSSIVCGVPVPTALAPTISVSSTSASTTISPTTSTPMTSVLTISAQEKQAQDPTYTYRGCYKDKKNDRSFFYEAQRWGASTSDCALLCRSYAYFLRQSKGRCFCGSGRYDKHGTSSKCKCGSSNVGNDLWCAYEYAVEDVVVASPTQRPRTEVPAQPTTSVQTISAQTISVPTIDAGILAKQYYLTVGIIFTIMIFRLPRRRSRRFNRQSVGYFSAFFLLVILVSFVSYRLVIQSTTTQPGATATLTVLVTGDMHGHVDGVPKLSAFVARRRASGPTLLFGTGDAFLGSAFFRRSGPTALGRAYRPLWYDAMGLGNHELEFKKSARVRGRIRRPPGVLQPPHAGRRPVGACSGVSGRVRDGVHGARPRGGK